MGLGRLVVVPSDALVAYERAGHDWLARYYNPAGAFDEVYALSPLEAGTRRAHGMTVVGVRPPEFGRRLREIAPRVVRAYGGYWPADLACAHRAPGVPVVVSVHDSAPRMLHRSVRYADLVLATSSVVAERVEAKGAPAGRVRLLPNRVDRRIFRPVADVGAVADRFPPGRALLHVGRATEQKNLETVVAALTHLPDDYYAVFVGRGDTARYRALADAAGVAARCHWVESVPNSELPRWSSWCACMCTPSRWEGFGIVFVEAAACGAAVVTSDIPPMNEYLEDGENALLVKEHEDPAAVAAAVRKACEDAPLRQRIKTGALAVAARFDLDAVDRLEVALYEEALALPPLPPLRRLEAAAWGAQERLKDRLMDQLGRPLRGAYRLARRIARR